MAYPLIIFGAGASFDSLKTLRHVGADRNELDTWCPPLTRDIFDVSRFSKIIEKYEDIKPLASTIINIAEEDSTFDFETYLTEQETQFPNKCYPQIIALRYYLAELLSKVSFHFYRHTNNHRHLLDQIEKRVGKAIVVNFNYDTLFEKNIRNIANSREIDSYITGDIKVIKIHGAHNWLFNPQSDFTKSSAYDYFVSSGQTLHREYNQKDKVHPVTIKDFDYPNEDFNLERYREHKENGYPGGTWLYYLPAVAIPIASKADFVCPSSHIKALTDALTDIDRILVIGWRAQDEHLLKLLKDHLKPKIKLTIVSSSEANAQKFSQNFKDIQQIDPKDVTISKSEGYTRYMIHREFENFLS